MSLFLPAPLLLLALASQRNAGKPITTSNAIEIENNDGTISPTVEIVEDPPARTIRKPQSGQTPVQRTSMLSDMLYYMGGPGASRISSVIKAMATLQQPASRIQLPMSSQQRAMGMLRVASQMSGMPSGPLGAMSLLSQTGQIGNIMSMLNNKSSGVNPLPSNIMDNVNKVLSGMDPGKKDELLSMAKQIIGGGSD